MGRSRCALGLPRSRSRRNAATEGPPDATTKAGANRVTQSNRRVKPFSLYARSANATSKSPQPHRIGRGEAPIICLAQPNGLGRLNESGVRAEGPAICRGIRNEQNAISNFLSRVQSRLVEPRVGSNHHIPECQSVNRQGPPGSLLTFPENLQEGQNAQTLHDEYSC